MQMKLLFRMSSQPIIISGMVTFIHRLLDNKPSQHWKCLLTLSFYSIFTNVLKLNMYDRCKNRNFPIITIKITQVHRNALHIFNY